MKLLNANYKAKAPIFIPYVLEEKKWMNNEPHSSTSIPMHQTNLHVSLIIFHPSTDRFYIIWNLRYGQVYILDFPYC